MRDAAGQTFEGEEIYADEFIVTLRDSHGWQHTWQRNTSHIEVHDPLAKHEMLLKTYSDKDIHDLFAYLETFK